MPKLKRQSTLMKIASDRRRKQAQRQRSTLAESEQEGQKEKEDHVRYENLRNNKKENAKLYQRRRLSDPLKRQEHNVKNSEAQKRRLSIQEKRVAHNVRNSEAQQRRLSVPQKWEAHNVRNSRAQRRRLSVQGNRETHNIRNSKAQRDRLAVPDKRQSHRKQLIKAQKCRMAIPELRQKHLDKLKLSQKRRLSNPKKKKEHQRRERASRTRRMTKSQSKRAAKLIQLRDSFKKRKERSSEKNRNQLFTNYLKTIKKGPSHVCDSCHRLWFRSSIKSMTVKEENKEFLNKICINMNKDRQFVLLCSSCYDAASALKVPALSLCHSELQFPNVPDEVKKLSPCEERFLCPRLPFMQIREVFGVRQYEVRGRVVNVPTTVNNSVRILPRVQSETATIPIALKRKKEYKNNYMFEVVRPRIIIQAALALKDCALFQHEGINIDLDRFEACDIGETEETSDDDETCNSGQNSDEEAQENVEENDRGQVPDSETLLQSDAIIFAPGEGNKPLSLFTDEYVEAKSFIKIYGGELIQKPCHLSYQNWVRSEIMREDRRCASSIPKLFFSALKLRTNKVVQSIGFCLRKSKCKSKEVTAKDLLNDSTISNIALFDSGFKIFASDRGSPAFFEEKKKELYAMLRQLGQPTFFITLSPAETKWPELLVILSKIVDNKSISEDEASKLPYEEKLRLIREDPVTCARYVDFRMRQIIKLMKKRQNSIFREHDVSDSYYRIEFQQRGSPHVHGLFWHKNFPTFTLGGDNDSVINFIDRFVTVSRDIEEELLGIQKHKHTFTCFKEKNGEKRCRFDIPFFPVEKTTILEPLDDTVEKERGKLLRIKRKELQAHLTQIDKDNRNISLDEFLGEVQCNYNEYILVIRSGLKRPTVFLKRHVNECMINAYNKEILQLHRANMDIQFILDAYSCANYVLNYVNKSKRGLSKLLYDAMEEVKRGNFSLKEKFRKVGNYFLNASEFSAQEAVFYILGMPLSRASRVCTFLNTSHPDRRVAVTKSKKQLAMLPDDSTDIFAKNILDYYTQRPDDLEEICLATFAAEYDYSKTDRTASKKVKKRVGDSDDESDSESETASASNSNFRCTALKDDSGYIMKRKIRKVIRYVRFNRETHEEDYYREHLMLFTPWRDERKDLLEVNHFQKFQKLYPIIKENKKVFVYSEELEDLLLQALVEEETSNSADNDDDDDFSRQNEFQIYEAEHEEGDILIDMDGSDQRIGDRVHNCHNENDMFPVPYVMDDSMYQDILASLNFKQRMYLLHVLHAFKTRSLPMYECVLGGAGVGKSRLITALQQTLIRFFNKNIGATLDLTRVLLCAFTGKAAYNIGGITLNTAFVLPQNQSQSEMPQLSSNVLNTIFSKLHDLQVIFIDEISMVGSRLFGRIDARLKQIFKTSSPFGGKSMITFGDFNQLGPIGDRYIFQPESSNPYGQLIGNPLWELFKSFELTEIMRQREDASFAVALNHLAVGCLTDQDVKLFESRQCDGRDIPKDALRLFRNNADVNAYNDSIISSKKNVICVSAVDVVQGQGNEKLAKRALSTAKTALIKDTAGLPTTLKLSIDIKYMITVNINIPDGLVNGAVGLLKYIEKNKDNNEPITLWFSFNEMDVGKKTRQGIRARPDDVHSSWTPIKKEARFFKPLPNASIGISRRQFPINPAEAITFCKSQGGTYPQVAVTLKPGLRRSEMYVAFSRCVSLNGLHLVGKFRPPGPPDPYDEVRIEMRKLRKKSVQPSCLFTFNYEDKKTILYHNAQSVRAHLRHIENDMNYLSACIVILAESWLKSGDQISLPNMSVIARQDVQQPVPHARGITVLAKNDEKVEIMYQSSSEEKGNAHNLLCMTLQDYAICSGYIPPSTSFKSISENFVQMLDAGLKTTLKVILLGDFNQNIRDNRNATLLYDVLSSRQLLNKINSNEPSTDAGTQIDICFSTAQCCITTGFSESFFSYHKPIICILEHMQEKESEVIEQTSIISVDKNVLPSSVCTKKRRKSSRLKDVVLDGVYLFNQLKNGSSFEDCYEVAANFTAFLRGATLYNGKFKESTKFSDDFTKIQTKGDGSCFYYAVSLLLCGSETLFYGLRAIVSAHMVQNEDHSKELKEYLSDSNTTATTVLDVTRFAEIVEVSIMANIVGRHIDVLEAGSGKWFRVTSLTSTTRKTSLHLLLDGQHYSALRKIGSRSFSKEFIQYPRDLPNFEVLQLHQEETL